MTNFPRNLLQNAAPSLQISIPLSDLQRGRCWPHGVETRCGDTSDLSFREEWRMNAEKSLSSIQRQFVQWRSQSRFAKAPPKQIPTLQRDKGALRAASQRNYVCWVFLVLAKLFILSWKSDILFSYILFNLYYVSVDKARLLCIMYAFFFEQNENLTYWVRRF